MLQSDEVENEHKKVFIRLQSEMLDDLREMEDVFTVRKLGLELP